MARKKKHEEHENHERWLVSYADFITLLFAFFVVMYSISSVNEGKYRVLSDAMISAFTNAGQSFEPIMIGNPSDTVNTVNRSNRNMPIAMGAKKMPIPVAGLSHRAESASAQEQGEEAQKYDDIGEANPEFDEIGSSDARSQSAAGGAKTSLDSIKKDIEGNLANLINSDLLTIRQHSNALEVELKSKVLFERGSARLSVRSEKILIKLASIISRFPNSIQVEGHTDDRPSGSGIYPSNWHLSASRAGSVTHLFAEHGVNPEDLWAVGYGEHRPLVANDTDEHRQQNRRVVLWIREPERKDPKPESIFEDAQLNKIPETGKDAPGSELDLNTGEINIDPGSLNAGQVDQQEEVKVKEQIISPIQLPSPTGFKPFSLSPKPAENTGNQQDLNTAPGGGQ